MGIETRNIFWGTVSFLTQIFCVYRTLLKASAVDGIEDVERGAELSFTGPLRGPCVIVKFWFQTTKF